MNRDEFFKRIIDRRIPDRLRSRRVSTVGLGSGGARLAEELGRLGVEQHLVDRSGEVLEEHNIIRHPLGYESLGTPKNSAMARRILSLNPEARVHVADLDVNADQSEFAALVDAVRPDVIAACTDNPEGQFAIEQVARPRRIPVVGAGVYDGGVGGEVWLSLPGGPCFGCFAEHLHLLRKRSAQEKRVDYSNPDVEELRSTCALNLDIAQIALLQARVCLHVLLDGDPDLLGMPAGTNFVVFGNRPVAGVFERPFEARFLKVAPHPECLICGNARPASAHAEAVAAALLRT